MSWSLSGKTALNIAPRGSPNDRVFLDKRELMKASASGGVVVAAAVAAEHVVGIGTYVALARLLAPEHFGQVAFAATVAMFFNSLTNSHGDKYVVREQSDTHDKLDNVFTLELLLATLFVALACLLAPLMMGLMGKGESSLYVQILAFSFFYNPLSRPRCLLERSLAFFRARFPFVVAQVFSAGIAIVLACLNFGVWSLIWWRLSVLLGEGLILWIITSYRPKLAWDWEIMKGIFSFGWPLMGSAFLTFFYLNIDYYIIGRTLEDGETQLGYYSLACMAGMHMLKTRQVLYNVLFPVFSRIQDTSFRAHLFLKLCRAVAGIFLLPTVLAVFFGEDILLCVLGAQWAPAVFPFQIIFITVLMRAISANMGYLLYSHGLTRPEFEVSIIYALFFPALAYWMTQHYGINGTALAVLALQFVTTTYAFTRYARPLTGKGVLHYFLCPWIISGATFALMAAAKTYQFALPVRLGVFALLIAATYVLTLRHVLKDILSARAILKPA